MHQCTITSRFKLSDDLIKWKKLILSGVTFIRTKSSNVFKYKCRWQRFEECVSGGMWVFFVLSVCVRRKIRVVKILINFTVDKIHYSQWSHGRDVYCDCQSWTLTHNCSVKMLVLDFIYILVKTKWIIFEEMVNTSTISCQFTAVKR